MAHVFYYQNQMPFMERNIKDHNETDRIDDLDLNRNSILDDGAGIRPVGNLGTPGGEDGDEDYQDEEEELDDADLDDDEVKAVSADMDDVETEAALDEDELDEEDLVADEDDDEDDDDL